MSRGRPPVLVGKPRLAAVAAILAGDSYRTVARTFGVSVGTVANLAKGARKPRRMPQTAPAAASAPPATSRPAVAPPSGAQAAPIDGDAELDRNLRARIETRELLLADLRESEEPRERAMVARALGDVVDGIDRVIRATHDPHSEQDEADEAEMFDAYMLRALGKARVIVAADGSDIEAEPTAEPNAEAS